MFTHSGVNGEYYFHYDNLGNTVLLTDEDSVPQYTALYDISNGKRVQEWNPNSLDFAIKSEGQEEKISFEISDIQLTLHYELTVRKYSAIAIIGNKDWIDLTVRGGVTIKTCGSKCPQGEYWQCECEYICTDPNGNQVHSTGIKSDAHCPSTIPSIEGNDQNGKKRTATNCHRIVGPVYCYCTKDGKRPNKN